jgi:hypothetical protein
MQQQMVSTTLKTQCEEEHTYVGLNDLKRCEEEHASMLADGPWMAPRVRMKNALTVSMTLNPVAKRAHHRSL